MFLKKKRREKKDHMGHIHLSNFQQNEKPDLNLLLTFTRLLDSFRL